MHNETGGLYFNQEKNQLSISINDMIYNRIGDNNMMGEMKGIFEHTYSFKESVSLAEANGYSINPIQQIQSEISREQSYSTGKHNITLTNGLIDIVNEKYGIFSSDETKKSIVKTETLYYPEPTGGDYIDVLLTGGKKKDMIERNYFKYNKISTQDKILNVVGKAYAVMEAVSGKHDNRNIHIYENWNIYIQATKGGGRLLEYRR